MAQYGSLCERHRRIQRRHGHAEQAGVTVQALAPYRKRVKMRMQKNADSTAWGILERRWKTIVKATEDNEANYQTGRAFVRHERDAGLEPQKLDKAVPVATLIETALAMYLMQYDQPSTFKSDTAFDYQVVRRIRGLTDTNAGTYWDNEAKRTKKVYRDLSPRTLEALARHLKLAFGLAGVYVAKLEQQEAEQQRSEHAALTEALENLK